MQNQENGKQVELFHLPETGLDIPVILKNESVWMTQEDMSGLFQTERSNITKHINNIFKEGELIENSVCANFSRTATDGKNYKIKHYNLDMIISVGYRINSKIGTKFRIWATDRLKQLLTKGYVLDEERLKKDSINFDELVERVRAIRTSERNLYRKITDIFATSTDYNSDSLIAKEFFATVQNKLHYAVHGDTAAEVIVKRADYTKERMGLLHWEGKKDITKADAKIAKNYLDNIELKLLELLCEQILSFAEFRYTAEMPTKMQDWANKIDNLLRLNEREILQGNGKVSRQEMESRIDDMLKKYKVRKLADSKKEHAGL